MNPLYNIWNISYIQQQTAQQYQEALQQQNHINQVIEIQKSAKALKDFLDCVDKIQPAYQQMASAEYCGILLGYLQKHNLI